jgi:hypothetical protein
VAAVPQPPPRHARLRPRRSRDQLRPRLPGRSPAAVSQRPRPPAVLEALAQALAPGPSHDTEDLAVMAERTGRPAQVLHTYQQAITAMEHAGPGAVAVLGIIPITRSGTHDIILHTRPSPSLGVLMLDGGGRP